MNFNLCKANAILALLLLQAAGGAQTAAPITQQNDKPASTQPTLNFQAAGQIGNFNPYVLHHYYSLENQRPFIPMPRRQAQFLLNAPSANIHGPLFNIGNYSITAQGKGLALKLPGIEVRIEKQRGNTGGLVLKF